MSKFKNAKIQDPLGDINDLSIIPEIKIAPEQIAQQNNEIPINPINSVTHRNVFYKKPKDKEIVNDIIIDEEDEEIPDEIEITDRIEEEVKEVKKRGKRGKDKIPRKKRILSDAQKEALAKGRKKSAEVRRAKRDARLALTTEVKKPIPVIPPPQQFKPLDYNTFCSYMDQYSQKVRKKHSESKQPHPNKKINPQLRPHPPKSKPNRISKPVQIPQPQQPEPQMHNWVGSYHDFTQPIPRKKKQNARWNFGL
jgi:hypothetical protein